MCNLQFVECDIFICDLLIHKTKYVRCLAVQVRTEAEKHLGLLGPVIRAEVGDTVKIVFRNAARFPTTIHAHGLRYNKTAEGAGYADGTSGALYITCCPDQLACACWNTFPCMPMQLISSQRAVAGFSG